ncbi:hypothetical protein D3C83_145430 [compost metagenome]
MGNAGAHDDGVRALFHALEFGNSRNVHQHVRLHQTQVEHGTERLSARQYLDDEILAAGERDHAGEVAWALVLER